MLVSWKWYYWKRRKYITVFYHVLLSQSHLPIFSFDMKTPGGSFPRSLLFDRSMSGGNGFRGELRCGLLTGSTALFTRRNCG